MMFFNGKIFCPELISDQRSRDVLLSILQSASEAIRPCDLLAGAIRQGDNQLLQTLSKVLHPGASLTELVSQAEIQSPVATVSNSSTHGNVMFTPQTLETLQEFEEIWHGSGGILDDVALELLLGCALARFDEQERNDWKLLDIDKAIFLFREQVAEAVSREDNNQEEQVEGEPGSDDSPFSSDEPFLLPPQLGHCEDLTYSAQSASDIDNEFPFDGEPQYEELFDTISRALHRRQANHLLLVGERGVGISTVLAELARRAATGKIPFLEHKRIICVICRYVTPEESLRQLGEILSKVGAHESLIVCLDGFGSLLRSDRGTNKAALLSALSHIRCQIIGLLTPHDYEELVAGDPDMADFFSPVTVDEPNVEVAQKLLAHFAIGLEQKYRVKIDQEAVHQAVVLSTNYILNERLPAKALKILNSVCEDIDYERGQLSTERDRVTVDDVIRVVSKTSGVPEETLRGIAEKCDYERSLGEVIFGQEDAVREVATELGLIKAGLIDSDKPASVMLFIGQTGTGKTEMAKALARFYSTSKRLKTYTLGNFVESHSVSGIVGVPAGYVGHDQGGRIINDLNSDPYGVFLLDEADKSHPDVMQPFLNLFDEGWICDQRGVKAYADKSIFILTTNAGQKMIADMTRQGKSMDEITARMKEAMSQIRHSKSNRPVFGPEFLSRIKRIVVFKSLDQEAMKGISRKLLGEMQQTWLDKRQKSLIIPEELIQYIAEEAHRLNEKSQGKEGGRIVHKLIADLISKNIQRETTDRPAEYRKAEKVVLEFTMSETKDSETGESGKRSPKPKISVSFQ